MDIIDKLNTLAEYQAQKDLLNLQKQDLIDAVLTAEVKAKLADIDIEFAGKALGVDENIATLTEEIKSAVKEFGASVKGDTLHAVFSKGRVSWDDKALQGYAVAHPELAEFRKQGDPSISIRKVA